MKQHNQPCDRGACYCTNKKCVHMIRTITELFFSLASDQAATSFSSLVRGSGKGSWLSARLLRQVLSSTKLLQQTDLQRQVSHCKFRVFLFFSESLAKSTTLLRWRESLEHQHILQEEEEHAIIKISEPGKLVPESSSNADHERGEKSGDSNQSGSDGGKSIRGGNI
ncbi:hypothetical protein LWI28_003674 [Acer negundo]|uniref:Uncharacterized protein n=1 Tax=Acer negundo TaxID=4023 RepID=A0AAD5ILX9_ACENE|nr:hypothetical protein LWI28_003674 [Acer negundo]